ncbi:MAG: hypothetical protein D6704_10075 [Nitrospirae bacterium]|nr:MAG: hypothetical protein D6704_10075 [Nitrospirota bacterium]
MDSQTGPPSAGTCRSRACVRKDPPSGPNTGPAGPLGGSRPYSPCQGSQSPGGQVPPSHPQVAALLERYRRQFARQALQPVGQALVTLVGERAAVRTRETNFGNLLADLLCREFAQDIALINSGQIRATIPAGTVTLGQVLSALPFDSSVVTLRITGRQLLAALENSARFLPEASGRFLQLSGLQVIYDLSMPPGSRVQAVAVKGKPLDPSGRYFIVTDAFLADGGDGYTMFRQASQRIDHQVPIRDVLLKAFRRGPLTAIRDHRIQIVSASAALSPLAP